jgi:hypothetical protein
MTTDTIKLIGLRCIIWPTILVASLFCAIMNPIAIIIIIAIIIDIILFGLTFIPFIPFFAWQINGNHCWLVKFSISFWGINMARDQYMNIKDVVENTKAKEIVTNKCGLVDENPQIELVCEGSSSSKSVIYAVNPSKSVICSKK